MVRGQPKSSGKLAFLRVMDMYLGQKKAVQQGIRGERQLFGHVVHGKPKSPRKLSFLRWCTCVRGKYNSSIRCPYSKIAVWPCGPWIAQAPGKLAFLRVIDMPHDMWKLVTSEG
jgi:hypothetical protein